MVTFFLLPFVYLPHLTSPRVANLLLLFFMMAEEILLSRMCNIRPHHLYLYNFSNRIYSLMLWFNFYSFSFISS